MLHQFYLIILHLRFYRHHPPFHHHHHHHHHHPSILILVLKFVRVAKHKERNPSDTVIASVGVVVAAVGATAVVGAAGAAGVETKVGVGLGWWSLQRSVLGGMGGC